jgi:retron-type reverse transcriptase
VQISDPVKTNKGVRQGCGPSPDLCNIYINKSIKEWKLSTQNGIKLNSQTILYADDQVIIAKSEDELQMTVNELNKIVKKCEMKMSSSKTRTVVLCGENKQRVKIEIEGKIIENVFNFNYIGYLI